MLFLDWAATGSIPTFPKFFLGKIIDDDAEVNLWRCLEESGPWLKNIDWTHLVLASGNLVLQKRKQSMSSQRLTGEAFLGPIKLSTDFFSQLESVFRLLSQKVLPDLFCLEHQKVKPVTARQDFSDLEGSTRLLLNHIRSNRSLMPNLSRKI